MGRTGTFIVIDAIIDMMHTEQKVDVFEFVSRIRNQRPQMVQTDVSGLQSVEITTFHSQRSISFCISTLICIPVLLHTWIIGKRTKPSRWMGVGEDDRVTLEL